jgi:tetratricopeptide (TPR) repeat protein/DNA-binding MarR family transcriptional regulator
VPALSYLPAEILDYLKTHSTTEGWATGIGQAELAKALGYHRCSMSRPLAELVTNGMLRAQRGPVQGGTRKQLVYTLTDQGQVYLRRESREVPMVAGAIPSPPEHFVGRKEELRRLEEAAHTGGILFVEGAAGMGKTSLVTKYVRRLRSNRLRFWFTVRAGSLPSHLTLALAHSLANLGGQQLAQYSRLPRQPIGREVADLIQRATGDRGIVIVLDDIHNAPPELRKFLTDLVTGFDDDRMDLFILIGQHGPFLDIEADPIHRLLVKGLDRQAAHELTDRRGGLAQRFEPIYEASLGSPLLLQLAVSSPGTDPTPRALPAALVARLTEEELRALAPLALAGESLPHLLLLKAPTLKATRLSELVQLGIVQRSPDGRIDMVQVVREELIGRIRPSDERWGHLQLASYYSGSRRAEAVRERFNHLVAAEAWRPASHMLAGQERSLLSLGYDDALRNSLRHLSRGMPSGLGRIKALKAEATVLRMHSEYSEALATLRRAAAESASDSPQRSECLVGTVELLVRLGQLDEADHALRQVHDRAPLSRRVEIMARIGQARVMEARGDLTTAQRTYEEVFETAQRLHLVDLELESIQRWSRLATIGGDRVTALRVIDEALPEAREAGRLDIVLNLLLTRSRAYSEIGQLGNAKADLSQVRDEAETSGYLYFLASANSGLCAVSAEAHQWREATTFGRQACGQAERLGNDTLLGHSLGLLCGCAYREAASPETSPADRVRLLDEALAYGQRGINILEKLPPSDSLVLIQSYLAELYIESGLAKEAQEHLDEANRIASALGMTWYKERMDSEIRPRLEAISTPGS